MTIAKMCTETIRSFRHLKGDLYVEVTTFYINTYNGMNEKIKSYVDKEKLGQTFYALHPDTKGVVSNTGMEIYEFMDGRKALMVGTGKDVYGNAI